MFKKRSSDKHVRFKPSDTRPTLIEHGFSTSVDVVNASRSAEQGG